MKGRVLIATMSLLSGAPAALAEPCVSATFDTPLKGAENVVTRQVDVPSPQFPGIWQEGNLDGYFYALYANGEGVLKAARKASDWEVKIQCAAEGAACDMQLTGTPSEDAQRVALILKQCLQGDQPAPPPPPAPEPLPEPEPVPEEVAAPCGIATVGDGTPVAVVQGLLVAAGADPGPVDGLLGSKTRNALVEILGAAASAMEIPDAVTALDQLLCGAQK